MASDRSKTGIVLLEAAPSCPARRSRPASLTWIADRARDTAGVIICRAGTPEAKAAPGGVQEILTLSRQTSVGATLGLTRTKSAAAFQAPTIQTTTSHQRVGPRVLHYASLLPTTSEDAVHESFYPAPGLHAKPAQRGRPSNEFWEITEELSATIRQGEEEHLADARRAYELTYLCIANTINGLAGKAFGPADTPHAAVEMAIAELGRRLPSGLGTNPADWVAALDRLLHMTETRDRNLWHAIETDAIRQEGGRVIERLRPNTFFRVGQVPSSEIVQL
ncbi:MAG: hypothetical protein AB7F89_03905 [Pirellulaceae bacterium]